MLSRTFERARFAVARQADRSRRFCWADLVTWALDGYRSPERLRDCRRGWACKEDQARCGACWCGKFRGAGGSSG